MSAVGFAEELDNRLVVAAGSQDADWALNLRHDPRCTATIGDKSHSCSAMELDGDERNRAVSQLILKYGTPAERLGRGPVFRLTPSA